MPYRRLPKTDAARLKALQMLIDNNDVYTVEGRFIDRSLLAKAQKIYAELSDAADQYRLSIRTQVRYAKRIVPLQQRAMTYISHFLQVLFLAIERGEIDGKNLDFYQLNPDNMTLPYLKTADAVMKWAPLIIEGEKKRLKSGGKPILSPSIGAVTTHFDVFRGMYDAQRQYQARSKSALDDISKLRPQTDQVILDLWNQIEKHFDDLHDEEKYEACRKYGVVYYYRRNEKPKIG